MSSAKLPLKGKVAIVTGAGRGLGEVMAFSLAQNGASVIAVDVNGKDVDSVATRSDGKILSLCGDVSSDEDMQRVVKAALDRFGHVDIAVCNAAVGLASIRDDYQTDAIKVWEVDPETLRRFFDVNVTGAFRLTRMVVPLMIEQGWGRIVNVTTSLGTMVRGGMFPYGSTKAANEAMASALAGDLSGTGVTVNVLIPGGAADTPFVPESPAIDRSKLVSPQVMGPPIAWLASDESDGITAMRFVAKDWDGSVDGSVSAMRCGAPIGWGSLIGEK